MPPFLSKYYLEVLISVLLGLPRHRMEPARRLCGAVLFGHAAFFGIGAYYLDAAAPPGGADAVGGHAVRRRPRRCLRSLRRVSVLPLWAQGAVLLSGDAGLRGDAAGRVGEHQGRGVFVGPGGADDTRGGSHVYSRASCLLLHHPRHGGIGADAVTWKIGRSRLGFSLAAVRKNEDARETAGAWTPLARSSAPWRCRRSSPRRGTFYAQYFAYILIRPSPSARACPSARCLPRGGAGTVLGPVLGSFVYPPSELTRFALRGRAGADVMLYGAILVLVISFLPQGIMGLVRECAGRGRDEPPRDDGIDQALRGAVAVSTSTSPSRRARSRAHRAERSRQDDALISIAGFHEPTSRGDPLQGQIHRGRQASRNLPLGLTRTFQIVQPLAGLSVIENVMVGAFDRERDAAAARQSAAEIVDFVGLGARGNAPARSLTLPDRKRLEIARGLATQPEMLLLDEADVRRLNPTEIEEIIGFNPAHPRPRRDPSDHRARHAGHHGALAPAGRPSPRREAGGGRVADSVARPAGHRGVPGSSA